jgi:hypothetical protein
MSLAEDWSLEGQRARYAEVRRRISSAGRVSADELGRADWKDDQPVALPPVVRDVINVSSFRPAKWKTIVDEELFRAGDVSFLELVSKRRHGPIVEIRRRICWRLKNETTMSYPQIGRALKRDHTSILHHVRKYQKLVDEGRAQP